MRTLSPCGDQVRRFDRDRFLLSLSAPKERRTALWALFAFNTEIARTREVVSEAMLGMIRLQWWRDALAAGNPVKGHYVLDELYPVIEKYGLDRRLFQTLIDAREFDLEGGEFSTLAEMEDYADRTSTPLTSLALSVLEDRTDADAIRRLSVAWALIGLARAGRFPLPQDTDMHAIVSRAEALLGGVEKGFLRTMQVFARTYLCRIRRCGFNVSDPRINTPPMMFMLRLLIG